LPIPGCCIYKNGIGRAIFVKLSDVMVKKWQKTRTEKYFLIGQCKQLSIVGSTVRKAQNYVFVNQKRFRVKLVKKMRKANDKKLFFMISTCYNITLVTK